MRGMIRMLAIAGLLLPALGAAQATPGEALRQPWGTLFRIERSHGVYRQGDTESHFGRNQNFEHLTFDIGNNKVLANAGPQGEIKFLTIYRDSYRGASSPNGWSGVWTGKDSSSYGPYSFRLRVGGPASPVVDLAKTDWDFRTGFLDNILPVSELTPPDGAYSVKLIAFAPISADGSQRLRGLIYALQLTSHAKDRLRGTVFLPALWAGGQDKNTAKLRWNQFDPFEFEIGLADSAKYSPERAFDLATGESVWVPVILYMPGEPVIEQVHAKGWLAWLDETWRYHRALLGRMSTPAEPYIAEFRERQILESLQSIAMSGSGRVAGSNWGSYPATRQIWIKDMFYSSLPLMGLDKSLARGLIHWFDENDIRQAGEIVEGGISHSISLTVASIILASLYYDQTADQSFFLQDPHLKDRWTRLLRDLAATRKNPDLWLFPTRFISDGALDCDYHTGSNVAVWRAFSGWSRILQEVYRDPAGASEWKLAAERVKRDLLKTTTSDSPFGRRFAEGTYADGRAPLEIADGEESDTTLMPFYGFLPASDKLYRATMRFAVSEYNRIYQPKVHAISWASAPVSPLDSRVPSTAPGYLKGAMAADPAKPWFEEGGVLAEIRRITDADGSVWWWSYGGNAKNLEYGKVVRGVPGKSGWFSGAYSVLFQKCFLGLSYDAPRRTLEVAPDAALGSFQWQQVSIGDGRFDVTASNKDGTRRITVRNRNAFPVTVQAGSVKRMQVVSGTSVTF
jgi:hypothetical protein